MFAVVFAGLLAAVKDVVAYIFTNDKEIVALVSKVMLIFSPFHLFDATAATCGGVLRGAGKQKVGAIANAVGYYVIGLPIGISLMFVYKLGVMGLWTGLIVCISLQATSFLVVVLCMDWKKAAEEAQIRAGLTARLGHPDDTAGADYLVGELELPNGDALSSLVHLGEGVGGQQLVPSEEMPHFIVSAAPGALSCKELLFWRGLALLLAVTILIAGVLIHLLL
ncbi:multidrug and toxin extrusion protein 2-like [Python bivittatus]|uniref:Multidrug and toxin extrusion protein 2-like n=1 Tax=Python bivittatus TaxID=176946 RepID=A0A9F2RDV3_PYTBI|nr:multidrug and toxin extrusion protein 2-like [Python bivittatus]